MLGRTRRVLGRILRSRSFLIGAGLLVAYALVGFLLVPRLVERYVPEFARDTLGRQASIGKVRINPFRLTFEADDVRVAEKDGTPIAGVRRLYLDLDSSSLLRWAWVMTNIRVEGLDLNLVTDPDGRLNLAELASDARGDEPAAANKDEAPVRMVLRHLALSDGRLTYTDRSESTPASVTLAPVNLELDDVTTLADRNSPYTIRARLPGGGSVRWRGEVSLRPVASNGVFSLTGFRPANLWEFVQDQFRLDPPAGEIDITTHYRFLFTGGKPQLVLQGADLRVAGLSLRPPGAAQPLLALQNVEASNIGVDLQRREVSVPKLEFSKGQVTAGIAQDGTLDWQTIAIAAKTTSTAAPAAGVAGARPWRVSFDGVRVSGVEVRIADQSRAEPLALDVGSVGIQAKARLEIGAAVSTVASDALRIELAKITVARLSDKTPLVTLESVTLEGDAIDTAKREIGLRELVVRGGGTRLSRDAQGKIDLFAALSAGEHGRPAAGVKPAAAAAWRLRLDALKLSELRIGLADSGFEPPLSFELENVSASLKHLSNDLRAPVEFEAALQVAAGGAVEATGKFTPDGAGADANVRLTRLDLAPLQPALARYAALRLVSGELSGNATLQYQAKKTGPTLRADGALSLDGLAIDAAQSGERVLAWKSLALAGVGFALAPDRLSVKDMRLLEPSAKITVFKDRSVNLAKLMLARAAPAASAPAASGSMPISLERLQVENGTIDFADFSLVLPFAARIREFGGRVTSISSAPTSRAEVKLEGRVDEKGRARLDGAFSPFAPKRFMDLRATFRNVEMPPMSAYSATFAGRKIASGTLALDLEYKIKDGGLQGDNKVRLDKFTLGERVEAPGALKLPLDLAVALLTDARGRIDVAFPLRGEVGNPKFSVGEVVQKAIANLVTKIVTAPFRALGALLGGGAKGLDAVAFDPGSSRLLPAELAALKSVAQALQLRPLLRVIVDGRFDAIRDGEALRAQKVRRELAAAQNVEPGPAGDPAPLVFDAAATQLALENFLSARAGAGAMAQFVAQFEQRAGRKADRVDAARARSGAGSPDGEFYQALYRRLVELEPLAPAELQALGQRRAAVVAQALVTEAGIDAARVAIGKTAPAREAANATVDTRLRLDVLKGKS